MRPLLFDTNGFSIVTIELKGSQRAFARAVRRVTPMS
jgi:hypothetical protein